MKWADEARCFICKLPTKRSISANNLVSFECETIWQAKDGCSFFFVLHNDGTTEIVNYRLTVKVDGVKYDVARQLDNLNGKIVKSPTRIWVTKTDRKGFIVQEKLCEIPPVDFFIDEDIEAKLSAVIKRVLNLKAFF